MPVSAISILSCDSSLSSLSLSCSKVLFKFVIMVFFISWFGWFLLAKPLEPWPPQTYWHHGPVSRKTIFPQTRQGQGWFRDVSSTLHLLCTFVSIIIISASPYLIRHRIPGGLEYKPLEVKGCVLFLCLPLL